MLPSGPVCARHRADLAEFAATGERRSGTEAALDHLERCDSCHAEVEGLALAALALRRLGADATAVEVPSDSWTRLRMRVGGRPAAAVWRARATLAGALLGAAMVAGLTAPSTVWHAPQAVRVEEAPYTTVRGMAGVRAEQAIQWTRFMLPVPAGAQPILAPGEVVAGWPGPDGIGVPSVDGGERPVDRAK